VVKKNTKMMKIRFVKKLLSIMAIIAIIAPLGLVPGAQASNYSFEQTSWAGGDGTGSVITHGFSGNRTKYDDASAKDVNPAIYLC
jgi:hypothetical protein